MRGRPPTAEARMVVDVAGPVRLGGLEHCAEQPVLAWQGAERRDQLVVHPGDQEAAESTLAVGDAQGGVPSAEQRPRLVHEPLQDQVDVELRGDGEYCVRDRAKLIGARLHSPGCYPGHGRGRRRSALRSTRAPGLSGEVGSSPEMGTELAMASTREPERTGRFTRPACAALRSSDGATNLDVERKRFTRAGILLGIGFGGFVDGIVLHQILQWHHMLTSTGEYPATTIAGLKANTLADGLFHASTWIAAFIGLFMTLNATRSGYGAANGRLLGLILAGWGLFNVVEGLVDHQILGIHHVRSGPHETLYDVSFLIFGALLIVGGQAVARRAEPDTKTVTTATANR